MTQSKYSDSELDNALFKEIISFRPSPERIIQLIAEGADVNAVTFDHKNILEMALENFQHISWRDDDGKRFAHLPDEEIDKILAKRIPSLSIDYIKALVENGADVNGSAGFQHEERVLLEAVYCFRLDLIEFLLQRGANPNYGIDEDGMSLLDRVEDEVYWFAVIDSHYQSEILSEMADLLRKYGAKNNKTKFRQREVAE